MPEKGKKVALVFILIFLATTVFFGYKYSETKKTADALQKIADTKNLNSKVIDFEGLFIEKVLKAQKEVSFDDRLQLENTVRDLKDQEILDAWNLFVNSKSQDEAQNAVKNLLGILVKKVRTNQ